jgi:hypothetical protein
VSAAPAASATAAGSSAAAAAAASGRLAMVGVVTGSWRGGSDGWRAVPLNQPLPSDSGLRQFVIITHAESFIVLCSCVRAKIKLNFESRSAKVLVSKFLSNFFWNNDS